MSYCEIIKVLKQKIFVNEMDAVVVFMILFNFIAFISKKLQNIRQAEREILEFLN